MKSSSTVSKSVELPQETILFLKLTQFLYGSANACYYAFLSIWLSHNDFTYSEIGYIRGLNQLSILTFVPILCLIIDLLSNTDQYKREFSFSVVCLTVAIGRLCFIFWEHSWNVIFCLLIIATIALQETANSTMDSILLSTIPNPNKYGRYRLYAGIGWGLVAFCLGLIFDYYLSINSMFYFFAGFMGCLGFIWLIPSIQHLYCNYDNNNNSEYKSSLFVNEVDSKPKLPNITFCGKLCLFLSQINMFKLQIICSFLVLGISFGVINTFLFLRLQEMGASTFLMGLTLIVTTCSEFPSFWFVEHAMVSIGDLGIVCVSLFAYILRLSWYGLLGLNGLNNAWYVLPAEALHGLTYAWIKASVCIFAHRLVHNNNEKDINIDWSSFSQGFLSAIFNGIGQGLGGVVGGIIFDKYGPHYLFFGNALALIPFFVVYVFQFCFCGSKWRVQSTNVSK